jgi:LmbE family N-acetylglucosaminyl deacetylase
MTSLRSDDPASWGTILSIWAHPDDESYLAAAVMAAARDAGQRVVCAVATAGENGADDPVAWPPSRLGPVRRWEAAAAMAVLGVEEHHILGLPDGSLADLEDEGLTWARGMLDDTSPDTVLTFGPEGMTYHPDHMAVHRWVTRAWQERPGRSRLLYATPTAGQLDRFREDFETWNVYMSDERPVGIPHDQLALLVEPRGQDLDRKLTALRAMATQTSGIWEALGPERYRELIAEEAFVAAQRITT